MSVLCVTSPEGIVCGFVPSSKFSQKIRYVFNLAELAELVPMEYVGIPECIKQYVSLLSFSSWIWARGLLLCHCAQEHRAVRKK